MRRIRGARSSSDEDPTLEALPDEPTLSAELDVRAVFERASKLGDHPPGEDTADTSLEKTVPGIPGAPFGEDTIPGTSAHLVKMAENPFRQEHTQPFIQPVGVLPQPTQAAPTLSSATDAYDPIVPTAEVPERSTPRVFQADDDEPYVPPGVGRSRARGIVIGVLAVCFLVCGAAGFRQYFLASAPPPAPPVVATATPTPSPTPTPTPTPTTPPSAEPAPVAMASSSPPPVATDPAPVTPIASTPHHANHATVPATIPRHASPPPAAAPAPKPPTPAKGGIDRTNPF